VKTRGQTAIKWSLFNRLFSAPHGLKTTLTALTGAHHAMKTYILVCSDAQTFLQTSRRRRRRRRLPPSPPVETQHVRTALLNLFLLVFWLLSVWKFNEEDLLLVPDIFFFSHDVKLASSLILWSGLWSNACSSCYFLGQSVWSLLSKTLLCHCSPPSSVIYPSFMSLFHQDDTSESNLQRKLFFSFISRTTKRFPSFQH